MSFTWKCSGRTPDVRLDPEFKISEEGSRGDREGEGAASRMEGAHGTGAG